MANRARQAVTASLDADKPGRRPFIATVLHRVLRDLSCGQLVVETPAKTEIVAEGARPGPHARLVIHDWRCLWRFVTRSDIGFAEAYLRGEWSSPNLAALFRLCCLNDALFASSWPRPPRLGLKLRHALNRNTRWRSRRNIAAHYDLGNAFYREWLDPGMTYSSALFVRTGESLDDAQAGKLDRAIELLDLSGGESILEIGCGWGSFAERVLAQPHVTVTGITLSAEQLDFARERLRARFPNARYDLRLQDYRDIGERFDRVVSIEMLEAVGEAYWPAYFSKIRESLNPGGIAAIQAITIDEARFAAYRRAPDFIQAYIFPGGMLPTENIIEAEISRAELRLVSREFFGASYARTLSEWQRRFQDAWPRIKPLGFDDRFKRMWEYYLAYCQAGFETGLINVGLYKIAR